MSCVDDAVSPQVEAIREQQVEFMKAKTGTEAALARFKDAETAYKIALTANEAAMNAANVADKAALTAKTIVETNGLVNLNTYNQSLYSWYLKDQEVKYNKAVADNAVDLKKLEVTLKEAEVAYQQSLKTLADAVALTKDTNAKVYFTNYETQANALKTFYSDQLDLDKKIADNKLILTYDTNVLANFTAKTNLDIAAKKLELKAQEESLKSLELVAANPASLDGQIDIKNLANNNIQKEIASLEIKKANADDAVKKAQNEVTAGQNIISKMLGYEKALFNITDSIESHGQLIKQYRADISKLNTDLSKLNKDLDNRKAAIINEKANYDAKKVLYDAAVVVRNTAQSDYYSKASDTQIALDNANGAQSGPLYVTYLAKKVLSDTALTTFGDKNGLLTTAGNLLQLTYNTFTATIAAVATTESLIITATTAIDSAESNLQKALVKYEKDGLELNRLSDLTTKGVFKADFDKARLDESKLSQAVAAKQVIATDIQDEINAFVATFNENITLINSLQTSRNSLQSLIDLVTVKKKNIVDTNIAIAALEQDILYASTEAKAKATAIANLAKSEKALTVLKTQIAATERQAKYWKDLLDKIFAV